MAKRFEKASSASQRQLRVGELIRHALADMLTRGEVHDPVLEGHIVTVPEVRMSADLQLATIYVMPLGGRDARAALKAAKGGEGRGPGRAGPRKAGRHARDAGGRGSHARLPGRARRPGRQARSARLRLLADRAGRGDKDRAVRDGRP